ncbi:ThuA domain-containing protein [Fibrella sp. HMF5335]|uniref:ThuA domain-containing protein n=2 Tax=Fibrella rubiginis TaxID=2817060 RepID=A0A939GC28_9BACT|nr:PVC-type heme-binding CxxCH protein [Fibrella rubiginis]MBO0935038.1 ThuA domain-containing protein [Fibrella rubiginis]
MAFPIKYTLIVAALTTLTLANCNRTPSRVLHNLGGKQPTTPTSTTILSGSSAAGDNAMRTGPRRTEILFLGDKGHHKPIERVPELMAALGNKGINITYTDRLEDLNTPNLNRFDGLLIYANWDSIPRPQERALLDYVSSGHGLIPVHCASYCFRNSAEYVDKVVGGQFWRHGMDSITTRAVQPDSPIMAGLKPFTAYDETYLHSHLQRDNNVLAVREVKPNQAKDLVAANRPNTPDEPYTWTRTYGKGRVFYTAYGHDERTWRQPGFQQLLERGILWAIGDVAKKQHDDLKPQAFTYKGANLPNYEKRPGEQLEQLPLSPEESMKHIQVPVDFTLSLFAHEPNVMHPIAMTWDDRGRLFVLITKDYPNERKPEGGSDSIVICEDTNGDGKADKFTNFAEGLSIPTGLVFANGGLIVSQAPHMLFLKDTNGDDKADVKKILFTGFGTFDTHAGPSNLHYGFDNWIWGCVGYSGFKGKVGTGDSLSFGQALFRFKADGSAMEHMATTSNNTWGMGFNETGDVFGSTANNSHGWYMAIPNGAYHARPNSMNGSRSTDTHKDMKPITGRVRQVDVFGGFTAAAGHNFYTARSFPKAYWNNVAFVCEPTGHIVHQNVMQKHGSDFEDAEGPSAGVNFNLMAGADEWFAPVFAETGPDGAVWVADWYSYIIQHNPVPEGFKNGAGNAYETNLRDFTHGRIYRVGYDKAMPQPQVPNLSMADPAGLLVALKHPNQFWRMAAQRLLVERKNTDVAPQLWAIANDPSVDGIGINAPAIHALWTLQGLGAITPADLQKALKHSSADVRKAAVQVMPRTAEGAALLLSNNLLADKEPVVVVNTLLALNETPASAATDAAVLARLKQATANDDRWLPDAFACAMNTHNARLLRQWLSTITMPPTATNAAMTSSQAAPMDHSKHQMGGSDMGRTASVKPATTSTNAPAAATLADLVVARIETDPARPVVREGTRGIIYVTNQGGTAIAKGTPVPLTMRFESKPGAGDGDRPALKIDYVSYTFKDGIQPGETVAIRRTNNGPWTGDLWMTTELAGDYTLSVQIDKDNTLPEGNKSNNTFSQTISFRAPAQMSTVAVERAARAYASTASPDSVVVMLQKATELDGDNALALVKGLSDGYDYGAKRKPAASHNTLLASLGKKLPDDARPRLNRLLEAWGLRDANADLDPNAQVVRLKTVREEMRYDKKAFSVVAGKPVVIILENPDAMQHNLVVIKPKSTERVGKLADAMITAKNGAEKNYVPESSDIVAATALVNPNQTVRLTFKAPDQPGEYPFVCTFPGHWRIMNGVMTVTKAPVVAGAVAK